MQHRLARAILPAVLAGSGIDQRSLALVNAARIADHPAIPDGLAERLLVSAGDLGPSTLIGQSELPPDPLPDEATDLIVWGLKLCSEHPMQMGSQLCSLWSLAEIWPHAQRIERQQLRRLWYWSLTSRRAPRESWIDRDQLVEWQRNLPTLHGGDAASPDALAGMLEEEQPDSAHYALAGYLGPNLHLPTLSWMLGAISGRSLLRRFDHRNLSQMSLFGTLAFENLCSTADPVHAVIVLSQLAHEIWWNYRSDRRPLLSGDPDTGVGLEEAVRRSDYCAAQRAARQACGRPERIWELAFRLIDELASSGNEHWPRMLAAIVVAHGRSGGKALAPDDAAVLGASMAGVIWLGKQHQSV